MDPIVTSHLITGSLALVAGTVAAVARKGGAVHARAGQIFVASMLVLGITATVLARLKPDPEPGLGGLFVCYFVATSWVSAQNRHGRTGLPEWVAATVALGAAGVLIWAGLSTAALTPVGNGPVFALAAVAVLAGSGDLRAAVLRNLTPAQRIRRHLWRMCFAFFLALASFLFGPAMPPEWHQAPGVWVLAALATLPIALMLYGLARYRKRNGRDLFLRAVNADPIRYNGGTRGSESL